MMDYGYERMREKLQTETGKRFYARVRLGNAVLVNKSNVTPTVTEVTYAPHNPALAEAKCFTVDFPFADEGDFETEFAIEL